MQVLAKPTLCWIEEKGNQHLVFMAAWLHGCQANEITTSVLPRPL